MHSIFSNALETLSDPQRSSNLVKLTCNNSRSRGKAHFSAPIYPPYKNQTDINFGKKISNVEQNRYPNLSAPLVDLTAEPVHPVVAVVAELPADVAVAVATEMVGPHPETTAWVEALASAPKLVDSVFEHLPLGSSFA